MFLKHQENGDLIEVLDLPALFDPFKQDVSGRYHAGEEMQETSSFTKSELVFPSGETLPACWTDGKYRERWTQ